MAAPQRSRWVGRGAEGLLAFGAGVASFTLVSLLLVAVSSDLVVVALGALCVAGAAALYRFAGIGYAACAALAALVAFDWFQFPPTHPHVFPASRDLANLLAYLVLGVVIGQAAAYAIRRATASEAARAELAAEQSALRRVAVRVARAESPGAIFSAVAEEVGVMLGMDGARVVCYGRDGQVVRLESWSARGEVDRLPVETVPLEATSLAGRVRGSGAVVRIDDYHEDGAPAPAAVAQMGVRSSIGAPILVDGRVWGAVLAWSRRHRPFPEAVDGRLADFADLIAVAISNTASREALTRVVEEQAALQRVATLVASGVAPQALFEAVAREAGQLLAVDAAHLLRYGADRTATILASWSRTGEPVAVGSRFDLEGESVMAGVFRTRRPARMGSYEDVSGMAAATARDIDIWSSVGAPILVEGRLWGVMIVSAKLEPVLPPETEARTAAFTELIATAIANSQARLELEQLAEEQAALRRVATLVATEPSSADVFHAVADAVRRLLRVENARVYRYEDDGTATVVADWREPGTTIGVGTNVTLEGANVIGQVLRTGRPARIDDHQGAVGTLARLARESGARSSVGAPISVSGRLWGAVVAATQRAEPLPPDAEARISQFTELVGTAISNTQAWSELAESRARIAAAADAERRRVVRDLHDGVQQRLVHTVITLKLASRELDAEWDGTEGQGPALVAEALGHAQVAMVELRELAHGIMPAVLTRGGLRAGVESLATRMSVPVDVAVSVGRLPPAVEATAYFVVAEALTNVAKHSGAAGVEVVARVEDDGLCVRVRDDGHGGARREGSGLTGLGDRLAIHDGRLRVESPAHGGTLVEAVIPLGDGAGWAP
jgi:signal transduction histidine kinase